MYVISSFITHPALISYRLWPRPPWNATITADNKYIEKKEREIVSFLWQNMEKM